MDKKYSILIVEDHALTSFALKTSLSCADYVSEILDVNCAADAFEVLKNKDIDLILLDLGLPEIDGVEAKYTEFEKIPDKLFEVGACGFGCTLMKTDPFFDVQSKFGNMFAPIGNNGEDVAFCWRARQCGFKVWCDPSIICGHVSNSVVDDKFFRAFHGG